MTLHITKVPDNFVIQPKNINPNRLSRELGKDWSLAAMIINHSNSKGKWTPFAQWQMTLANQSELDEFVQKGWLIRDKDDYFVTTYFIQTMHKFSQP